MFYMHWLIKIRVLSKSLSVRATAFALIAFIAAFFAVGFSYIVPDRIADLLGGTATKDVLDILAKSMLIVVTFSMSTLVATYSMITGSTTPRATKLVMEDSSAHNALSTFLGAFIYSVVSLISLSTNLYGPKGRVILFVITIFVIIIVVTTIIKWIGRLSNLGRLENIIKRIEDQIEKSIKHPNVSFSWNSLRTDKMKEKEHPFIFKTNIYGDLQSIDMKNLEKLAIRENIEIYLEINVGDIIGPGTLLAYLSRSLQSDEDLLKEIESCFFVGKIRSFDEDPRYGIIVLSELASRALSSGVNDPGTAIQVTRSLMRIIFGLNQVERKDFKRVYPKPIEALEIFDIAFSGISRDGAKNVEVLMALQEGFSFLSKFENFRGPCLEFSMTSLERAKLSLVYPGDYKKIKSGTTIT